MADGFYRLTIMASESGIYSNEIQLASTAPVDLGQILLPEPPKPAPSPKAEACVDYTGGDVHKQAELNRIKSRVKGRLPWVREFRGHEYESVVSDFLNNCYPNMPMREFKDGDETVEAGRTGLLTYKKIPVANWFYGVGFREHKRTCTTILESLPWAITNAFKANSIRLDEEELCKSGQQIFDLFQVLRGSYANYWYGQGGDPAPPNAEPEEGYWAFGATLVGGMGAYGHPHGEPTPEYPDKRKITGKIVASPAGKGKGKLVLRDVEFQMWDAFDFIPGNDGGFPLGLAITWDLKNLEYWNYAYDIPLYIHWKYDGIEFPIGVIEQADLGCCKPEDCDPCKQPTAGGSGGGSVSAKDVSSVSGGGGTRPDFCRIVLRPVSVDPNEIVGPGGFGTEHWISPDQTFHYTVRFENDPKKAEVPAQAVRITQQLSTNLDLRTFRLGVMGFGTNLVDVPPDRAFYQTQVNVTNDLGVVVDILASLDLAKGVITWEFTSIDPATGDLPWDPYIGFLPPNTNGIIGQGFVSYTIKPKAGIASGDIINAEARIYFDYNEPMDTPHIFNTVDASLPTSTVLPLTLTTNRNIFPVRWAGADAYGGAGIGGFDIYVSDNSGSWHPWLQNTPYWEQLFVGECGHTYAFYSVARDNVGNREARIAAPQAQIYVLPNTPPVLEPITNRLMAVGQTLCITNRASDPDAGQQVTFSLAAGAPAGMSVDPASGVLKWTPACVQGGSSNIITVVATDDGCGNLSSAQSFAVVVTECLQTGLGTAVSRAGSSGCIPVSLESSFGLTNLTFTVSVPGGRFTNFTVTATAPEVGSAMLVSVGSTQAVVVLAAQPGQVMRGPKEFAQVCFALVPDQPSAFMQMEVQDILGLRENGTPIGNAWGSPGRTVVVGAEPLLECVQGTNGQPLLLLYGKPVSGYALDTRTNITVGSWRTVLTNLTVGTNLYLSISPPASSSPANFYRALRAVQSGPP